MITALVLIFFLLFITVPVLTLVGLLKPAWLNQIFRKKRIYQSRVQVFKEGLLAELATFVALLVVGSQLSQPTTGQAGVVATTTPAVVSEATAVPTVEDPDAALSSPKPTYTPSPSPSLTPKPFLPSPTPEAGASASPKP